jgi:hypothetical protein
MIRNVKIIGWAITVSSVIAGIVICVLPDAIYPVFRVPVSILAGGALVFGIRMLRERPLCKMAQYVLLRILLIVALAVSWAYYAGCSKSTYAPAGIVFGLFISLGIMDLIRKLDNEDSCN